MTRVDEALGARVVGHHDDRLLEGAVELAQQRQDLDRALRVEIAGRLVGDDEVRVGDDGARDRDALLLAAGELRRRDGARGAASADRGERDLGAPPAVGARQRR